MSLNVYEPCACGSGKKFKFCCFKNRQSIEGLSEADLIKKATEFPVYDVRVSMGWQNDGLAQVVVARQLPNLKFLLGIYLVDVFCLGLKDSFVRTHLKYDELTELLGHFPGKLEDCDYEDARSIVLGGIEYAQQLGFEPIKDWKQTKHIIESERDFEHNYTFGKDGMPFYIQGPNDDPDKILQKLQPLINKGIAHTMSELAQNDYADDFDNDFDEDDSELDDQYNEVIGFLEHGQFDKAKNLIDDLTMQYPTLSEPKFLMGSYLALVGKKQEAIPFLEEAAMINLTPEVFYTLACTYAEIRMLRESMINLKKVIEFDHKDGDFSLKAKREIAKISSVIKQTTGLSFDNYIYNKTIFDEAFSKLTKGQYELAIEGFNRIIATEPNHVQSYGNLGIAFAAMGDCDKAIKHFDKAIRRCPLLS